MQKQGTRNLRALERRRRRKIIPLTSFRRTRRSTLPDSRCRYQAPFGQVLHARAVSDSRRKPFSKGQGRPQEREARYVPCLRRTLSGRTASAEVQAAPTAQLGAENSGSLDRLCSLLPLGRGVLSSAPSSHHPSLARPRLRKLGSIFSAPNSIEGPGSSRPVGSGSTRSSRSEN